jgi:hypothetical protein
MTSGVRVYYYIILQADSSIYHQQWEATKLDFRRNLSTNTRSSIYHQNTIFLSGHNSNDHLTQKPRIDTKYTYRVASN